MTQFKLRYRFKGTGITMLYSDAVQATLSAYVRDIYTIRSSGQKSQIVIFINLSCMLTVVDWHLKAHPATCCLREENLTINLTVLKNWLLTSVNTSFGLRPLRYNSTCTWSRFWSVGSNGGIALGQCMLNSSYYVIKSVMNTAIDERQDHVVGSCPTFNNGWTTHMDNKTNSSIPHQYGQSPNKGWTIRVLGNIFLM